MADKAAGSASERGAKDAPASGQRLKLQTDYGQAVMWSKGFAAEETKAAFRAPRSSRAMPAILRSALPPITANALCASLAAKCGRPRR